MARRANEHRSVDLVDLPVTPGAGGPGCKPSSTRAEVNDKLARQVFDGVLAGEGTPDEVVAARGSWRWSPTKERWVRGGGCARSPTNPDVAEKIRGGKVGGRRSAHRRR